MRKLWTGARVGEAELGPPLARRRGRTARLIGSWGGFLLDRACCQGVRRLGGVRRAELVAADRGGDRALSRTRRKRAVLTNVVVRLDAETPSPNGPDDPFDLIGPRSVALERLRHLKALGFDDVVLVPARHEAPYLEEAPALV